MIELAGTVLVVLGLVMVIASVVLVLRGTPVRPIRATRPRPALPTIALDVPVIVYRGDDDKLARLVLHAGAGPVDENGRYVVQEYSDGGRELLDNGRWRGGRRRSRRV